MFSIPLIKRLAVIAGEIVAAAQWLIIINMLLKFSSANYCIIYVFQPNYRNRLQFTLLHGANLCKQKMRA